MKNKYITYITLTILIINTLLILFNIYFELFIRLNFIISLLGLMLLIIHIKNIKSYSLITLLLISTINITIYLIHANNNLNKKNNIIETINCKLNNKEYIYDIIYNETNHKYIILNNKTLKNDVSYDTEEEVKNLITTIFQNKGATCTIDSNDKIDLDIAYE